MRQATLSSNDTGGITLWMLMWFFLFAGFTGLAVDLSNVYRNRAMLQVAADVASHAGVVAMIEEKGDGLVVSDAVAAGAKIRGFAGSTAPIDETNVELGYWNPTAGTFSAGGLKNAVRVTASLDQAGGNPVATFFLGIMQIDSFDVTVNSVSYVAYPPCANNGIISNEATTLTSNVDFGEGMCIHGEQIISTNNNITFGEGSVISTPDIRSAAEGGNLEVPTGNLAYIQSHAKPGSMIPLAAREDNVRERWRDLLSIIQSPENVELYKRVTHGNSKPTSWDIQADLDAGYRYFYLTCSNSQNRFEFPTDSAFKLVDAVIVSTCELRSQGSVYMKDVVLGVDNTSADSIFLNGKSEVTSGVTDCADAGSLIAFTTGGMKFTADTSFANLELLASGDISYTAGGDTNYNISIQAWGSTTMTANGSFGNCPTANGYTVKWEPFPRIVSSY